MVCGDQHSPHDPHGSPFRPRFFRRLAQSLHDLFMIFYKAIRRGCQPPPPRVVYFYFIVSIHIFRTLQNDLYQIKPLYIAISLRVQGYAEIDYHTR